MTMCAFSYWKAKLLSGGIFKSLYELKTNLILIEDGSK